MNNNRYKLTEIFILLIFFSINLGTFFGLKIGDKQLNITYSEVLLVLALLCSLFILRLKISIPINSYFLLTLIIILWTLLVTFWSDQKGQNISVSIALIVGLTSCILAYNSFVKNYNLYHMSQRAFGIFLLLFLLINISIELLNGYNLNSSSFYELKYLAKTPLGASNYLAIFFEFLIINEVILKKRHWTSFISIYTFGFLLTLSRGGDISLIIGLLLVLIFKRLSFKGFIAIVFAIFLSQMWVIQNGSKGTQVLQTESIEQSRISIWEQHILKFLESPFLGSGYQYSKLPDAHNIVLNILTSYGLIGFILFSLLGIILFSKIILNLIWEVRNQDNHAIDNSLALLFPFVTILCHSMLEPFFTSPASQIFLGYFVAAIYANYRKTPLKVDIYLNRIFSNFFSNTKKFRSSKYEGSNN